jgi:hypothetical protein
MLVLLLLLLGGFCCWLQVNVSGCNFTNNTLAFRAVQNSFIGIYNSSITRSRTRAVDISGAAVAVSGNAHVSLHGCTVTHGWAEWGGAGIACDWNGTVTVQSSVLHWNTAGKGGAIFARRTCRVGIEDSVLSNNTADARYEKSGGAIALDEDVVLDVSAGSLIAFNTAGSGGGVWSTSPNLNASQLLQTVRNNTAESNPDIHTPLTELTLLSQSFFNDFVCRFSADPKSLLPVHLLVLGRYKLPFGSGLTQCMLLHDSFNAPIFLAANRSLSSGDAFMTLRIRQHPGNYTVSCNLAEATGIPAVNISLHVRACWRGEVSPTPDSCQECRAGYWSIDPTDQVCSPCPGLASCPGGSLLLPQPGAWRATANSSQVHR